MSVTVLGESEAPAAQVDRLVRLAGELNGVGSMAYAVALPRTLTALRAFLCAPLAVAVVRWGASAQTLTHLDPGGAVVDGDPLELLDPGHDGHVAGIDAPFLAGTRLPQRSVSHAHLIPLDLGSTGEAVIAVVDDGPRQPSALDRVGMSLSSLAAATVIGRHLQGVRDDTRELDQFTRLEEQVATAMLAQDITGNGIAVALGYLDALAHDRVPVEDRQQVAGSAGRRLAVVQQTVNDLVDSTTRRILESEEPRPVEVLEAWRRSHPFAAAWTGSRQPMALARRASFARFLGAADAFLVPEITAEGGHILLELTDASRLDLHARTLLSASGGTLEHRQGRTYAAWPAVDQSVLAAVPRSSR